LNSSKEVQAFRNIHQVIFINAYGTYILNLVDAAIEDQHYDPNLFQFTLMALSALNEQKDPEIITNIFDIQLLERFGV
ncbi:DNA repair protein RecO, partial [Enterococcus faecalis]|uniref:DNA repair protein RecO n=1 Tax=Enterococcus faecalis TaxID=1351 RepID=UPI003CC66102